ncbi:hypothetical protein [Bradyrhizobium japonicum]
MIDILNAFPTDDLSAVEAAFTEALGHGVHPAPAQHHGSPTRTRHSS